MKRTLLFATIISVSVLLAGEARCQKKIPRILNGQTTPRILNGTPASIDEFESVGIVGSVRLGGFCSGTLISSTHVLTAGHCAEAMDGPTTGTFEIAGKVYTTSNVIAHPDYNNNTLDNDIAILVLSEPVTGVSPTPIFTMTPKEGDVLTIVGYGSGGDGISGADDAFGVKMWGETTIDMVTDTLIVWEFDSNDESNTGFGDSGGPGLLNIEGEWFIASVTSSGTEADAGLGDIAFNTRVDAYADWILGIVMADQGQGQGQGEDPGQMEDDEQSQDQGQTDDEGQTQGNHCPANNGHRPGNHRPGNHRPGNHRPGNHRPGNHRPGNSFRPSFRPGPNRGPSVSPGNRQQPVFRPNWQGSNRQSDRR